MAILHLTGDLMFSSRVSAAARQQSVDCLMASSSDSLPSPPESSPMSLVMIDLATPGLRIDEAMPLVRAAYADVHVVAYASHVHESTLAAARAAGCDEVLSRGQFNSRMDELVGRDL